MSVCTFFKFHRKKIKTNTPTAHNERSGGDESLTCIMKRDLPAHKQSSEYLKHLLSVFCRVGGVADPHAAQSFYLQLFALTDD